MARSMEKEAKGDVEKGRKKEVIGAGESWNLKRNIYTGDFFLGIRSLAQSQNCLSNFALLKRTGSNSEIRKFP